MQPRALEFAIGRHAFVVAPRDAATIEVHRAGVPGKDRAYAAVAQRFAPAGVRPRQGGGAFIGNETGPGGDDAAPAGLLLGSAGQLARVDVFGVEPGARTRPAARVFAARDCLGGGCRSRSGPLLTAQLLERWRQEGTRPSAIGFDVDGTLVERYVPGAGGFGHATLDDYPLLRSELVALVGDQHPFFFLTRSPLGSVRERLLDPLAGALFHACISAPLPTWIVSSSLTVLDELRLDGSGGHGTVRAVRAVRAVRDAEFGREFRLLPAELEAILEVVQGPQGRGGLLAAAYQRAIGWKQRLQAAGALPARALARYRGLLGALELPAADSPKLRPVVEVRPGDVVLNDPLGPDVRVLSMNPIAPGHRAALANALVGALGGTAAHRGAAH